MCRVGGPRCEEKGGPLRKEYENARRSRNHNAHLARTAAEEGNEEDAEKYLAMSAKHGERMDAIEDEMRQHEQETEKAALAEQVAQHDAATEDTATLRSMVEDADAKGLRKVLDVPLADYAPEAVRERLRSQEFRSLIDRERELGAALDALDKAKDGGGEVAAVDYHRALDAHRAAKADLMDYRLETARIIEGTAQTREASFALPDGVHEVGEAESGSAEWLRMRQNTLGGSDVGAICKVGEWGHLNYNDVRESKMDLDPQDQDHEGAALIGDIWEPHLAAAASDALGQEVYTNKATYSDGKRHANLDGFTKDGENVGTVVEMKTGSQADKWEDAPPEGYTLQTQHYVDVVGAKDGLIVANINDDRLVMYRVGVEDKVPAGPKSIKKLGEEFSYSDVRSYSEGMVEKWNTDREARRTGDANPTTRRRFEMTDEEKGVWRQALDKGVVFADLETSHMSASRGHIIEFGGMDEQGNELQRLYGVPDDHARWNGTGAQDVHGISPAMVSDRPVLLEDASSVEEIKAFVGDRVLVAHNASFEDRWLKEAGIKVQTADSMRAFGALAEGDDIKDNSMASFTKWAGVEYQDAHRAMPDTRMMAQSFGKLRALIEEAVR